MNFFYKFRIRDSKPSRRTCPQNVAVSAMRGILGGMGGMPGNRNRQTPRSKTLSENTSENQTQSPQVDKYVSPSRKPNFNKVNGPVKNNYRNPLLETGESKSNTTLNRPNRGRYRDKNSKKSDRDTKVSLKDNKIISEINIIF